MEIFQSQLASEIFIYLLTLIIISFTILGFGKAINIKSKGFNIWITLLTSLVFGIITFLFGLFWQPLNQEILPERVLLISFLTFCILYYFYRQREINISQTLSIFFIFYTIYTLISLYFFEFKIIIP